MLTQPQRDKIFQNLVQESETQMLEYTPKHGECYSCAITTNTMPNSVDNAIFHKYGYDSLKKMANEGNLYAGAILQRMVNAGIIKSF